LTETPRPPAGLKSRGRGLWKQVLTSYKLDAGEMQLLGELCRAVDLIDTLDAEIAEGGLLITGSRGQVARSNPLLLDLREVQKLVSRLVNELALPVAGETVGVRRNPQQRQAAKQRWSRPRRVHG
jgi:hypothetical protein